MLAVKKNFIMDDSLVNKYFNNIDLQNNKHKKYLKLWWTLQPKNRSHG